MTHNSAVGFGQKHALLDNAIESSTPARLRKILREICHESDAAFNLACSKLLLEQGTLKIEKEDDDHLEEVTDMAFLESHPINAAFAPAAQAPHHLNAFAQSSMPANMSKKMVHQLYKKLEQMSLDGVPETDPEFMKVRRSLLVVRQHTQHLQAQKQQQEQQQHQHHSRQYHQQHLYQQQNQQQQQLQYQLYQPQKKQYQPRLQRSFPQEPPQTQEREYTAHKVEIRVEMCVQCDEEYDTTDNLENNCIWHEGEIEHDEDAECWKSYADHTLPQDSAENRDAMPEGFRWACCHAESDSPGGCQETIHRPVPVKRVKT